MSSYQSNIVKKPWGYEYLAYENDKVAVWILYIKNNEKTSMHCHPNKTTGLVLLDGKAEVSFLSDKKYLEPLSKIMIRKGIFHQTKSVDENGSFVLEIETPVDKGDLVRFKDNYGREGTPYEDSTFEYPKAEDCVWLEVPKSTNRVNSYSVSGTLLDVHKVDNISFFEQLDENKNIIFLDGGIKTEYGINVAGAGDVVSSSVLKDLIKVFTNIGENTAVVTMERC